MPAAFRLPSFPQLPILDALPALRAALTTSPRVVLEAPPGAGKTTVVPLELLAAEWRGADDKILVLEPRQLAAPRRRRPARPATGRARGPNRGLPRAAR